LGLSLLGKFGGILLHRSVVLLKAIRHSWKVILLLRENQTFSSDLVKLQRSNQSFHHLSGISEVFFVLQLKINIYITT
jgi:hypothetical protein